MKFIFLIFFISVSTILKAQNLVPNSSFEDTIMCPTAGGQVERARFWYTVENTPDFFHSCFIYPQLSIPSNAFGYQFAKTGEAYMGLWVYFSWTTFPEIIGTKLISPLSIGEKYYMSFNACLAWNPSYGNNTAIDKLGIYLSESDNLITPPPINNYSQLFSNSIILDSINWTTISGEFIADSAFEYLSIGNFFDTNNTDTLHLNNSNAYQAYYYIDDVCISRDSLLCKKIPFATDQYIKIFPNPASGNINILNIPIDIIKIDVLDINARILKSIDLKKNSSLEIDLTGSAAGVYYLNFKSDNSIQTHKLLFINK